MTGPGAPAATPTTMTTTDLTERSWATLELALDEHETLTVTVHGTGQGNVLGGACWHELDQLAHLLPGLRPVRSVLLRGAGEDFSLGLDLRWYLTRLRRARRDGRPREALLADIRWIQQVITAFAGVPQPTVAVLDGACVGAALELASACDLRIATARARFELPEAELGVVADLGGLQRLPRLISDGLLRELALTGGPFDALRAERIGLVNTTTRAMGDAVGRAHELVARIRDKPAPTVAGVKSVLDAAAHGALTEGLDRVARWNAEHLDPADVARRMAQRLG